MSWPLLLVSILVLVVVDLVVIGRRGGTLSARGAVMASFLWIGIALAFGAVLLVAGDPGQGSAYFAGYLVEKTLSLDNVFVFLLVFGALGVPEADRHRLLSFGIVLALALRAGAIFAGAALLDSFGWVSFVFAAVLLWTAVGMLRHRHDHGGESKLVDGLLRRLPLSGAAAALVAFAVVDVIFAVDSVPAILAITDDTFVVFAANAFALLGLRPLFFVVEDLVRKLPELKTALALVLVFIAGKLIWGELVAKVPPEVSLPVVALILGGGVLASLRKRPRALKTAQA